MAIRSVGVVEAPQAELQRTEGEPVSRRELGAAHLAAVQERAVLAPLVDDGHPVSFDDQDGVAPRDSRERKHVPGRCMAADGIGALGEVEGELHAV